MFRGMITAHLQTPHRRVAGDRGWGVWCVQCPHTPMRHQAYCTTWCPPTTPTHCNPVYSPVSPPSPHCQLMHGTCSTIFASIIGVVWHVAGVDVLTNPCWDDSDDEDDDDDDDGHDGWVQRDEMCTYQYMFSLSLYGTHALSCSFPSPPSSSSSLSRGVGIIIARGWRVGRLCAPGPRACLYTRCPTHSWWKKSTH